MLISWTIIYILDKREKIGGHQTICLSGGPNLTPPPQISRIIQFKILRSVILSLYNSIYYLYEVILHYKAKKEQEKKKTQFKLAYSATKTSFSTSNLGFGN